MKKKKEKYKPLTRMSDEELIKYARDNGRGMTLSQYEEKHKAAYQELGKRNIRDEVVKIGILVRKARKGGFFLDMTDEELIKYTRENGRAMEVSQFQSKQNGAYKELGRRGLIDEVVKMCILVRKVRKGISLKDKSDEELIEYVGENAKGMALKQFQGKYGRVYQELGKRNIREEVVKRGILIRVKKNTQKDERRKNLEYLLEQVKIIMEKEGWKDLPSQTTLQSKGYGTYSNAIKLYHGGFHVFRERLGEETKYKPAGYWDIKKMKSEIEEIMRKHNFDKIPGAWLLRKLGYPSLGDAITRNVGFVKFRRIMKEEKDESIEKLKDRNYVFEQLKKVMKENGMKKLPSENKLRKLGYSDIGYAIYRYHGGMNAFRKMVGEPLKRDKFPGGKWKDLEFTLAEGKRIIEELGYEELPSAIVLEEHKYYGFSNAISKYHGGFHVFRQKLRQYLGIKRETIEGLLEGYVNGDNVLQEPEL